MKLKTQKQFFNEQNLVKNYADEYNKNDKNYKILNSILPKKEVLSLGCGGGREVRELVRKGCKVTALDFSEKMVNQSKEVEPKAKYYCDDAVNFAEKNKTKLKFDYILGLFTFLNYISKRDRKPLVQNLFKMLKKNGLIIFEVRMINDRWTDLIKVMIAPFSAIYFRKLKEYEFGDVYSKDPFDKSKFLVSHHYTKKQLKGIFKGMKFKIEKIRKSNNGTKIIIKGSNHNNAFKLRCMKKKDGRDIN